MEPVVHQFSDLFRQLGLPDDESSITSFIARHRSLPNRIRLADAPFWSAAQADFLRSEIVEDADWAELVDRLDISLRD